MPTGYTEAIQSGEITELADYAMRCARNFGACVMMRDDPMDAEIKEFEPSAFYRENLESTKAELAEFELMTRREREQLRKREHTAQLSQAEEAIKEKQLHRERYESMLEKAKGYKPPTADHEGLAEFMVSQLEESIKFDCDCDYWEAQKKAQQQSFDEWEQTRIETLHKRIARYASEWQKEQERTEGRNRWISQLRDSLRPEHASRTED